MIYRKSELIISLEARKNNWIQRQQNPASKVLTETEIRVMFIFAKNTL